MPFPFQNEVQEEHWKRAWTLETCYPLHTALVSQHPQASSGVVAGAAAFGDAAAGGVVAVVYHRSHHAQTLDNSPGHIP